MKLELDVRNAMRRLSEDSLNQLYSDSFSRISAGEIFARNTALQTFSWLLCMQEALHPNAFVTAIAMKDLDGQQQLSVSDLIDTCLNLVVLDSKLNILRFAHVSFQEFLETKPEFSRSRVHSLAAISCLHICMQGPDAQVEATSYQIDDFYRYGALYWAEHYRAASITDPDDEVSIKLREFLFEEDEPSMSFIGWIDIKRQFSEALQDDHPMKKPLSAIPNTVYSLFFTACVFGLVQLFQDIGHTEGFDWNQRNEFGATGLYLASRFGYEAIVGILICHGAEVNVIGAKYSNPLQASCFAGHTDIVTVLLEHGADPHVSGTFANALEASFIGHHENIAQLLLGSKYQISKQEDYDLVLHQSAQARFVGVMGLVQKKFAATFATGTSAQYSAVQLAVFKGRQGVLHQFLR